MSFGGRRALAHLFCGAVMVGGSAVAGCGGSGGGTASSTSTSTATQTSSAASVAAGASAKTVMGRGSACRAGYVAVLARAARVRIGQVKMAAGAGRDQQPACRLRAGVINAVVGVDSGANALQRLKREIAPAGQPPSSGHAVSPPEPVTGVGLQAAWIPAHDQLIAADHRALVTVTVSWPHTREVQRVQLARALARVALVSA